MQKNLTKTQATALQLLRSRLDPTDPMFAATEGVAKALGGDARLYLVSYVYPLLAYILEGEQWHGQAEGIRMDHAQRKATVERAARERAKREPVWAVDSVTRSNAGGLLYNAVRIDDNTECSHEPTYSHAAAQERADRLNLRAPAKVISDSDHAMRTDPLVRKGHA